MCTFSTNPTEQDCNVFVAPKFWEMLALISRKGFVSRGGFLCLTPRCDTLSLNLFLGSKQIASLPPEAHAGREKHSTFLLSTIGRVCSLPCHELLLGRPFSQISEMCLASGILSLHEWDSPLDLHTRHGHNIISINTAD